ncbi:hypothetical protein B0H14DRAFT_233329 [Mycena olivaceomarginata]|nr:hypothetical protein B0H14DRAFT_233329 [Mycena olivaceomarginata]
MYCRLGPWTAALAPALFHGQEDHGGDLYRPFVSGFDGIERRSLISSRFLRPVPTSLAHTTPTATSSPRPARRLRSSALLLYNPNSHHASSNAACCCLSPRVLLFSVLTRLFSCPLPRDPAPLLQTKITVVLAIHLSTDSYPRQTSMPLSH